MTDWRTHVAIAIAAFSVAAFSVMRSWLRGRRRMSERPTEPDFSIETHVSASGLLKAVVFPDRGEVLRVQVYAKQDDGPYGQPWIPIATSFADRQGLHGVLRDALQGEYT